MGPNIDKCLIRARCKRVARNKCMAQERCYSDYYHQLQQDAKQRYNAKLDSIEVHIDDPYTFIDRRMLAMFNSMPDIQYPDINNYLINTPTPYTNEELKDTNTC